MTTEEKEDLYLRSLDTSLKESEQRLLDEALTSHYPFKKVAENFVQIREGI